MCISAVNKCLPGDISFNSAKDKKTPQRKRMELAEPVVIKPLKNCIYIQQDRVQAMLYYGKSFFFLFFSNSNQAFSDELVNSSSRSSFNA